MTETFQSYANLIWTQRTWSWALIGMVYLIAAMTVRAWFLGPLAGQLKGIGPKPVREFKKVYLKKSVGGWLFFLLSLAAWIFLWLRHASFPVTIPAASWLAAGLVCYILSIVLHLMAFASAALEILKQQTIEDSSKPIRF